MAQFDKYEVEHEIDHDENVKFNRRRRLKMYQSKMKAKLQNQMTSVNSGWDIQQWQLPGGLL